MSNIVGVFFSWHHFNREYIMFALLIIIMAIYYKPVMPQMPLERLTTKICMPVDKQSLRARHKSCFLRPDTGPCRADIIQYYFDAKQGNCYRFFWGGCQGNGNRFDTRRECINYCVINATAPEMRVPHFCNLAFDFGTCFGHYNRWGWDKYAKTCKRRLYSGCGGNQNNFETQKECMSTCLNPPNNTMYGSHKYTTCVPFTIN